MEYLLGPYILPDTMLSVLHELIHSYLATDVKILIILKLQDIKPRQ